MREIPYGEGNFERLRNGNAIYIDKTMYIEKRENLKKYVIVFNGFEDVLVEEL